jgi:hypothetical protein
MPGVLRRIESILAAIAAAQTAGTAIVVSGICFSLTP